MAEKFFYGWTKDDVWGVIESTFKWKTEGEDDTSQDCDKKDAVEKEFNKLADDEGSYTIGLVLTSIVDKIC